MNELYSKFMSCNGDILGQTGIGMFGVVWLLLALLNAGHSRRVDNQCRRQCLKLAG